MRFTLESRERVNVVVAERRKRGISMFTQNESTIDRVIRFVLGAVLVYVWYAALVTGVLATVALVIRIILVLTGLIGWCPLYSLFGMKTH